MIPFFDPHFELGVLYLAISIGYLSGSHGRAARYGIGACALCVAVVYLCQAPFFPPQGTMPPAELRQTVET